VIGSESNDSWASANGAMLIACTPTARTRRVPASYWKMTARRIRANRQTASHSRS